MTHRLHADAVTLRRDARTVSRNLSLAIPEGSFSVIVGPNACGKSTLLAALSRLLAPAEGRVVLDGRDIHSLPGREVARRLGLLPQSALAPAADAHAEHRGHSAQAGHAMPMDMPMPAGIPLQRVVDIARERGVAAGYGIALPSGMEGVYTISVFPDDPRHDATLHIDQYSGKVLADVRWQDYNAVARSVQMGVVLHEGKLFGLGNQLLMLAVCLAILLSSASGLWIWWKRKPAGRLGVPPLRHELPRWKTGIAIMLALGVAFPLVGASLLLVWALDWLVLSRLPAVRRVLA